MLSCIPANSETSGGLFLKFKNAVFDDKQEKDFLIYVRKGKKKRPLRASRFQTVILEDGLNYSTFTVMIDSYTLTLKFLY